MYIYCTLRVDQSFSIFQASFFFIIIPSCQPHSCSTNTDKIKNKGPRKQMDDAKDMNIIPFILMCPFPIHIFVADGDDTEDSQSSSSSSAHRDAEQRNS